MRTWIIIFVIAAILSGLAASEIYIVGKFCSEVEDVISDICNNAKKDEISKDKLDNLSSIWQKNKTLVFALTNHHMFSDYEGEIVEMYYSHNKGDTEKLYHAAVKLKNVNKRLEDTIRFNLGNIF